MMPYELTYIIPARIKESGQTRSAILDIIKEKGGEIWTEIDFGKRRLSYAIDHARNGEFIGVEFQTDRSKISQIKDALNIFDDIARFQISQIEKLSDKENLKTNILRSEIFASSESRHPFRGNENIQNSPLPIKETFEKPAESLIKKTESLGMPAKETVAEPTISAEKTEPEKVLPKKEVKVSIEDLDKKLEEILDEEVK